MTRSEAEIQVRERWERLGLEPLNFPNVFGMDVENALEWDETRGRNLAKDAFAQIQP